jgi:Leucine-rich repeat (LRR) protein
MHIQLLDFIGTPDLNTFHVQKLLLSEAPDLICGNLMCEKLGSPCLCRITVALQRFPLLTHLDISRNAIPAVPEAICKEYLPSLQHLNLSNNRISELPSALKSFQQLQVEMFSSQRTVK